MVSQNGWELYGCCVPYVFRIIYFFVDLQWKTPQDLAAENYMMPYGHAAFSNPYWTGMQPGMDGYMAPYPGAMPYTGFGLGPFDMPFGGIVPQDPFGAQGYLFPPVPPQRYALVMSFSNCSLSGGCYSKLNLIRDLGHM